MQFDESILEQARQKLLAKNGGKRFIKFVDVMNNMLTSESKLLGKKSLEEDAREYEAYSSHAERLWEDACLLFKAGSYPTSLFMSIVCMEETGKIGVARFELAMNEAMRAAEAAGQDTSQPAGSSLPRRKGPFYSHPKKHLLAAGAGAVVNSRLDRILGIDRVIEFLDAVDTGDIERLRQRCIYVEREDTGPYLPYEEIGPEQAKFYTVLSGELLAEILGFAASEFERLLDRVKGWERCLGMKSE